MSDYPQIEEERQVEILDRFYTGEEVIKDVISGLKFQKKKRVLLERVYFREFDEIIVLYNYRCKDLVSGSFGLISGSFNSNFNT